jgi:polar amino acid transport system substrate-binding protein
VALLLQPTVAFALPDSITLVADSWCPYNCAPTSDKPGYVIEIAQAIYEPQGISVHYDIVPWTRALHATRRGKYTAVIGATKTEAKGCLFPQQPIGISTYHFYTTTEKTWKHTTIAALNAVTVGVIDGYNYSDEMDAFILKHKDHRTHVQIVSGDTATTQNIKKLFAGRIDVMLEDPNVVSNALMQTQRHDHLRDAGMLKTLESEDALYLAFSPKQKDSAALVKMFDEGINTLRANEKLEDILNKYGLVDWQ